MLCTSVIYLNLRANELLSLSSLESIMLRLVCNSPYEYGYVNALFYAGDKVMMQKTEDQLQWEILELSCKNKIVEKNIT